MSELSPKRLRAVAGDFDAIGQSGLLECSQRQFKVLGVVFDKQNLDDS
jgi:hypothetical protein